MVKYTETGWGDYLARQQKFARSRGFTNFDQYKHSAAWTEVFNGYVQARLPIGCMLCGWHWFDLIHSTWDSEQPDTLLPLCKEHVEKLIQVMQRMDVSDDQTKRCLPYCLDDRANFNLSVYRYRVGLLTYRLRELGQRFELQPLSVLGKRSGKTSSKLIVLPEIRKQFLFCVSQGYVQVERGGRRYDFDEFYKNLGDLCREGAGYDTGKRAAKAIVEIPPAR